MGAAAAAPRRAPVSQPAQPTRKSSPQRRRNTRRKRPNRALASPRAGRTTGARITQPALAGAARLPHAAVRTAGAVRDLSDSSLIMRLTRGRGWIALLGTMLFGIVTLNVVSLSLNAGNGRIGTEIDALERHNSALRAELAEQFSSSRVQSAAAELGLAVPDPRDVHYVNASDDNVSKLAELLGTDDFLSGEFEPTDYPDPGESYTPAPVSGTSSSPTPAPSPAPTPAAPPASAPPSGGGGTGGTGGVGL